MTDDIFRPKLFLGGRGWGVGLSVQGCFMNGLRTSQIVQEPCLEIS